MTSETPTYLPRRHRPRGAMPAAILVIVLLIALGLLIFGANSHFERQANPTPPTSGPATLTIPSLGVETSVVSLGLNPDRAMEVPSNYHEAGWYNKSVVPGAIGTSVIVGHLDSATGPALFYNLNDLKPGDKIIVTNSHGDQFTYVVEHSENYSQDNFPTLKVYSHTDQPSLRLITCSGSFNQSTDRYSHNLVVYAVLEK